jgi:organic hydroperoxide reductase OsmC/OhrA
MSVYFASVYWEKGAGEPYIDNKYSRAHTWSFDGGATVLASSSPHIVPVPYSVEANVDPEEAFVASLSSCHMLFFLSIAAKKRFVVEKYVDNAQCLMDKDTNGKMAITQVTLKPKVTFSEGVNPSLSVLEKMHHQSHEQCFIANSVKAEIVTEIVM